VKIEKRHEHDVDLSDIADLDEINGDEQLAYIWCKKHNKYEWHSLNYDHQTKRVYL